MRTSRKWDPEEDIVLQEAYTIGGWILAAKRLPSRSKKAIKARAAKQGLRVQKINYGAHQSSMTRSWSIACSRLERMTDRKYSSEDFCQEWGINRKPALAFLAKLMGDGYIERVGDNAYQRTEKPIGEQWERAHEWNPKTRAIRAKREESADEDEDKPLANEGRCFYAMPLFRLGEVKGMFGWDGHADLRKWHPESR